MSLVLNELDQIALASDQAVEAVQDAQAALVGDEMAVAKEALMRARDLTHRAYQMLQGLIAYLPPSLEAQERGHVPLPLLSTPRSRDFLETLRAARRSAEAVDQERGWVGDGAACGWAEEVEALIARVALEVEGPQGRE